LSAKEKKQNSVLRAISQCGNASEVSRLRTVKELKSKEEKKNYIITTPLG